MKNNSLTNQKKAVNPEILIEPDSASICTETDVSSTVLQLQTIARVGGRVFDVNGVEVRYLVDDKMFRAETEEARWCASRM